MGKKSVDEKSDIWKIIGVFIALTSLLFGPNICGRITETSVFKNLSFPKSISSSPTNVPSTPTKTSVPINTPNPALLAEITDSQKVIMRLVSAGEFSMGSEVGDGDEKPLHQVYLDDFYMDKYEVTNALYKACVEVGACTPPQQTTSYTRSSYYGNSEFDDYPVIYVDWDQAQTYCKWRGASLPTEAQWEKAVRGTDRRTYPWGDQGVGCDKANYWGKGNGCVGDTTKVGSYESGKSPYGIYDMAGNVREWTADWYSGTYYPNSPSENPLGPDLSPNGSRVLRGGSWFDDDYILRVSNREWYIDFPFNIGFRCARLP